ncbi:PAS domain S-box protein [Robertkochia marina]|uniref:histidine kinase n=1 Tax=Robertkochia marina TaxID=1227945 RepID=A0A4S3M0S1_9FLAO|nr:PAS domain S-box protein [Robertkochia marina]THD67603.1 PAS domain S-box protein [Robertkochia marina]TRZ44528.1 PAS domain S-box protein [Robertkochia marina]
MQLTSRIEVLERALKREKAARKAAEAILEEKSSELYQLSQELKLSNLKLEELLSRKTSELKGVFENINDAYVVMELSGDVIKMNDAAVDLLGFDVKKEPVNLMQLVKKEYLDYTVNAFRELYTKGQYKNYKAVIRTKGGYEKNVQINASIIRNKQGKPIAAQGIARDITQETKMKRLMELQKQQLDIIFKNSPIGVSLIDPDAPGFLMVNQALCEMLGYEEEVLKKLTVKELTHPEDQETSEKMIKKLYTGELDTFITEKRYIQKSGSTLWAKTSVTAVRDYSGEIEYQVATIEDITEQKLANEKLRESENRMSTLIMNMQTGILLEDENRKIQITNQRFCEMFGIPVPPEAMKGADCSQAAEESKHHFTDPENFVSRITTILKERKTVISEELRLVNGKIYERSYIPIFSKGLYKGHLWSYDDVTLRKRYKENLQAQKDKYSNIIANMNLGLIEVDNEDCVLFANQSFCDMSGYSLDELRGKKASDLLLLEEFKDVLSGKNKNRTSGIYDSYEVKIRNKKGEIRDWLVSGGPNYDVNGRIIGSIGIHLDITEQKQLEAKKNELLEDLEIRNEQLNDYAHIVSHDLKSPLRNISALLSWTKEDFRDKLGSGSLKNIELMESKVEQMDHLIENILKYSSIEAKNLRRERIDTHQLVMDIISMIYIPDHIEVQIVHHLPVIYADSTRIQQLFQNLISNAVNYIDKPKGLVTIGVEKNDKEYIFHISDNGCGIPKAYHDKIFKIFSSANNNANKSSGIGLSIVKKIVDLYDGRVWLESTPGEGTTFFFSIRQNN